MYVIQEEVKDTTFQLKTNSYTHEKQNILRSKGGPHGDVNILRYQNVILLTPSLQALKPPPPINHVITLDVY